MIELVTNKIFFKKNGSKGKWFLFCTEFFHDEYILVYKMRFTQYMVHIISKSSFCHFQIAYIAY